MADIRQPGSPANWLEEPRKIPSTLNVMTILTFIGCAYLALGQIYSFFTAQKNYEKLVEVQDKLDDMPGFAKKLMGPQMVEMARMAYENRVPILLLTIVGAGLCTYGALAMRRFKKLGFYVYVIGEILPIVTSFLFIGMGAFGVFGVVGTILIPAVFIIIYATQLKYLS